MSTEQQIVIRSLIKFILELKLQNPDDPRIEQTRQLIRNIKRGH